MNISDKQIEKLWMDLEDIPINSETEKLESDFFIWSIGTDKDDIWKWFSKHHSRGLYYLVNEFEATILC